MTINSKKRAEAQGRVVQQILDALEKGHVPWQTEWLSGRPTSLWSGKPYKGLNSMWLGFVSAIKGYSDPRWMTLGKAKKLRGDFKGEETQQILRPQPKQIHEGDCRAKTWEQCAGPVCFTYIYWNTSAVFNVEQVKGIELKPWRKKPGPRKPIKAAEKLSEKYLKRENIDLKFQNETPHYHPKKDYISIPRLEDFISPAAYAGTMMHEITHSTGSTGRLGRFKKDSAVSHEDRSVEELTAEIGSAFLKAECGVKGGQKNTTAYIQSWLTALTNDKGMLIKASSTAQKAVDFVLGVK